MRVTTFICVAIVALGFCACNDCEDIKDDASKLVSEYQKCETGDTCVAASMFDLAGSNNCLGPFQCPKAFNADKDLAAFSKSAKKLVKDYEGCGECVQAGCQGEGEFYADCNEVDGVCELVLIEDQ